MEEINLKKYCEMVEKASTIQVRGKIKEVTGLVVKAVVPGVRMGELCEIYVKDLFPGMKAEVVGFKDNVVYLMPYGDLEGIGLDSEVIATGHGFTVKISEALSGKVLDGLGNSTEKIDGESKNEVTEYPVTAASPHPLKRAKIQNALEVGIKVIDGLLTIGEGQRIGVFAAAGVGKSTLLGMIARHCSADVNVIGLIGERGREVKEFIEENLGEEGLKKSIVIAATSDQPALIRLKAGFVATAIAEYYRDCGKKVMFLMDSITRFARAQREIGLAVGEPPARYGYPPSVFSYLARLLERAGNSEKGSITAFYTILVEGDDMNEPVSDEVRAILDGHIVLSRVLADENHYPAVDVLRSVSRVMNAVVPAGHRHAAARLRKVLSTYERHKDLILIGAYKNGSDPEIDYAIKKIKLIQEFLQQDQKEFFSSNETVAGLCNIFSEKD